MISSLISCWHGVPKVGSSRQFAHPSQIVTGHDLPATFPYIDAPTQVLHQYALWWRKVQKLRVGMEHPNSDVEDAVIALQHSVEIKLQGVLKKALQRHPLYNWLEQFAGLRGSMVGYLIGTIRDPHRFPGQLCAEGHHQRVRGGEGAPCLVDRCDPDDQSVSQCDALLLAPRRGTGVAALHTYFGLGCGEDGRSQRKRKGVMANFHTQAKGFILGPRGVAQQIVIRRIEPYATIYDKAKDRLGTRVTGSGVGDGTHIYFPGGPLRVFQADAIARKIAAKAFLADLLIEWKRVGAHPLTIL